MTGKREKILISNAHPVANRPVPRREKVQEIELLESGVRVLF
jgi:hypothetical protein